MICAAAGYAGGMAKKDPRVDAYIQEAAKFAQPILKHLRKVVHAALPAVEEDLKWGMPHFMHKGMLCGMAAFKQHCAFGFWRAKELAKLHKAFVASDEAMYQFGRITKKSELPSDKLITKMVKAAAALNERGKKALRTAKSKKPVPKLPPAFLAALKKSKKAHATFAAFSPSHQREYIEWLHTRFTTKTSAPVEKSRDSGATWMSCAFAVWLWLFYPGSTVGFGSRKEILVDRAGDLQSIFEKVRSIVRNLPHYLKPRGFKEHTHSNYMRLLNPANDATIVGSDDRCAHRHFVTPRRHALQ